MLSYHEAERGCGGVVCVDSGNALFPYISWLANAQPSAAGSAIMIRAS